MTELLEGLGKHFQDPVLARHLGEGDNPLSASLSRMRTQIEAMAASLQVVRQIWTSNSKLYPSERILLKLFD
jgi:hypothetical protein